MPTTQLRIVNARESEIIVPEVVVDLASFRRWVLSESFPEGQCRPSFLGGKLELDMSPEELGSHSSPKGALTAGLIAYFDELDLGEVYTDGMLLVSEEANLCTEPDLMAATWDTLEAEKLRATPDERSGHRIVELQGAPDVVVEIVSRSSVRKDTEVLRTAYFTAGIPEYWLIDCRGLEIDFQLLKAAPEGYLATTPLPDGWLTSSVLQANVLLTRTRNRMGRWRYQLQIEPTDDI